MLTLLVLLSFFFFSFYLRYEPKSNTFVTINGYHEPLRMARGSAGGARRASVETARLFVGGMTDAVFHSVMLMRRLLSYEELKALANDMGIQ